LVALLILLSSVAVAATPTKRVYTGLYLHDVTKLDQKDGVFDVDLDLWAKWRGQFDADQLTLTNAAGDIDRDVLSEETDGDWHSARWRVRGTLRGEFPLGRFPFDAQTLAVTLELPANVAELVPDLASSGVRGRFSVTGWLYQPVFRPRITTETYRSDLGSLANEGRPTAVNRVSFEVTLRRPLLLVALKLFLPLGIILLVALLALFLPAEQIEARSGIGVTALLSCFAFQFTVAGSLPDVAYLTIADGMFIVSYTTTATALVVSIIGFYLDHSGRAGHAKRLDKWSRAMLLALTVVPAALLMRPEKATPPPLPPLPAPPQRQLSARDTLRVATLNLASLTASPAASGLFWDAVHTEPDGQKTPFLVDSLAAVSSESLRFVGDGELEVTWRLRKGLLWSDGHPVTSADLALARSVSPDPDVVEVATPNESTLVVRYRDRVAQALEGPSVLPSWLLAPVAADGGYESVRKQRQSQPLPVIGPYRVVDWKADDHLTIEANPHFSGPPPSVRRIEIKHFASSEEAVAAFERAEVDFLWPNTATPDEARALQARRPQSVLMRGSATFIYLAMDLAQPQLAKLDVRRALLMAIDRETIRREVYGDEGRVAHAPLPEMLADVKPIGYDPVAARALLAQAGAAGLKLPLQHGPSPIDRANARRVADCLRQVGVDAQLVEVKRPADLYRERRFGGGLLLYAARATRETSPRAFWTLPLRDGRYAPEARNPAFTDEVAALAERERRALYPERRAQLQDRIHGLFAARLPVLPLLFASERVVADPSLRGWDHGVEARIGDGLEGWYFAKPEAPSSPPPKE